MGDIYVLYGDPHCGKSSTIKEVYRILSLKYPNCINKNIIQPDEYDILKVEMYNIKDLPIGIRSEGDSKNRLEKTLKDFALNNCNIIFCAESLAKNISQLLKSNPRNKKSILKNTTVEQWAANWKSPKYNVTPFFQQKNPGTDQARKNWRQARKMIKQAGL